MLFTIYRRTTVVIIGSLEQNDRILRKLIQFIVSKLCCIHKKSVAWLICDEYPLKRITEAMDNIDSDVIARVLEVPNISRFPAEFDGSPSFARSPDLPLTSGIAEVSDLWLLLHFGVIEVFHP